MDLNLLRLQQVTLKVFHGRILYLLKPFSFLNFCFHNNIQILGNAADKEKAKESYQSTFEPASSMNIPCTTLFNS